MVIESASAFKPVLKPLLISMFVLFHAFLINRKFIAFVISSSAIASLFMVRNYLSGLNMIYLAQVIEQSWYVAAMPYVLPALVAGGVGAFIGKRGKNAQASVVEGDAIEKMQKVYSKMVKDVDDKLVVLTEDNEAFRKHNQSMQIQIESLKDQVESRDDKIEALTKGVESRNNKIDKLLKQIDNFKLGN